MILSKQTDPYTTTDFLFQSDQISTITIEEVVGECGVIVGNYMDFLRSTKVLLKTQQSKIMSKKDPERTTLCCSLIGPRKRRYRNWQRIHSSIRPMKDCYIPMEKHPTLFLAETTAILECCQENLRQGFKGKSISIFSKSQATIRALSYQEISSRLLSGNAAISIVGKCGTK